jgi:hypothetical protein
VTEQLAAARLHCLRKLLCGWDLPEENPLAWWAHGMHLLAKMLLKLPFHTVQKKKFARRAELEVLAERKEPPQVAW